MTTRATTKRAEHGAVRKISVAKLIDEVNVSAHRLGMDRQWHIDVEVRPDPTLKRRSVDAYSTWLKGYRVGTIVFAEAILAAPARYRTRTIWHELIHLFIARYTDLLARYCGKESVVTDAMAEAEEGIVDELAMVLLRAFSRKKNAVKD